MFAEIGHQSSQKTHRKAVPRNQAKRALTTRLTAMVAQFEGELGAVRDERDRLLATVDEERGFWIAAEIRAAGAEAKLETVYRRHWWQVWRPERPEE